MDNKLKDEFREFGNDWKLKKAAREKIHEFILAIKNKEMHKVQELFELIDGIVLGKEQDQFILSLKEGEKIYRARLVEPEHYHGYGLKANVQNNCYETKGYDEMNSIEPPLGITQAGRNNISGVSYLYASESATTACCEIKPAGGCLISVAELIVKKDLQLIDFSTEKWFDKNISHEVGFSIPVFFTELMKSYTVPIINHDEYYLTQVITDHFRKTGIDGIAYMSHFTKEKNYTIFNSHKSRILFNNSRLLYSEVPLYGFIDFNEKKTLTSREELFTYDKKRADELMEQIHIAFIDGNTEGK